MSETLKKTDDIVAKFTQELLDLAREKNIDFGYVGHLKTRPDEIIKVMQENQKVVGKLVNGVNNG